MNKKNLALVIEDDPDAATIFSTALKANDFDTIESIPDGNAALTRLSEIEPAIVVLDMHLPEVAGNIILQQIREDPRLDDTKVVIVTADPRMAEAVEELADLVLIKPVAFSQVRDLIARLK